MLGQWWSSEALPPLERLSGDQARRVLEKIAELDYSQRPFDEATG